MALKITLKPFERIEIGPLTLTNGWIEPSCFSIEGLAPVLRQVHTLVPDQANTTLKAVYLCLQNAYLGRNGASLDDYQAAAKRLRHEMPGVAVAIDEIADDIAAGQLYGALKRLRMLLIRAGEGDGFTPVESGPNETNSVPSNELCTVWKVRDRRRYRVSADDRLAPGGVMSRRSRKALEAGARDRKAHRQNG